MSDDPRLRASRYRADRLQEQLEAEGLAEPESAATSVESGSAAPTSHRDTADADQRSTGGMTASDRAAYIESSIQQAIRRGEFDDLPGAGKPIDDLGTSHDPDWWIRRKIASEKITGLGPPALTLRIEHTEFVERLDALSREDDVREYVEDFNRRVIDARRQLQGGPPVVTPTHDADAEVAAWRERRAARFASSARTAIPEQPRRPWWQFWRR